MRSCLEKNQKHYRLKKHISQTQFIAYGFFLIIMTGSLLLMLPYSQQGRAERAIPQLPVYGNQRFPA